MPDPCICKKIGADRIVDPQQFEPLAGKRAVVDLRARVGFRIRRRAVDRRLIRAPRAAASR